MKKHKDGVLGSRSPKWAFMSKMVIPSKRPDAREGDFYLARLRIIETPFFGVLLHRIGEPDNEPDPHDHPWNFKSIILRGSYLENVHPFPVMNPQHYFQRRWLCWSIHKMTTEKAHCIIQADPGTITLVLHGRRKRDWGFHTPSGWVNWREYKGLKVTS
jgi:hypothetical protein